MGVTYDPVAYWRERGRTFASEHPAAWDAEDPALTHVLAPLDSSSIFDVGCGYGRVGAILQRLFPQAAYLGLDVSPDLAATTAKRLGAEVITADLATFDTGRRFDLVLAISTLGHLRPADVGTVLDRMRTWALRDLVVMDWDETGSATGYQYAHDYRALMPTAERIPVGRLSIYHERRS